MSLDDTGGGRGYGGGDYDYWDYDASGSEHENNTTHETPAFSSLSMNIYEGRDYDGMNNFLKKALDILTAYERHICLVKQRPYNLEIYEIDKRVSYLRGIINDHKEDKPEEVKKIEKMISTMKNERIRLQLAENALNVEKFEGINLRKLYIKKRYRFCDENSEDFRPDYDPRTDPELKKLIQTALEYEDDYTDMIIRETDFSNLNERVEKLIEDYGLQEVQKRVKSMINPYTYVI